MRGTGDLIRCVAELDDFDGAFRSIAEKVLRSARAAARAPASASLAPCSRAARSPFRSFARSLVPRDRSHTHAHTYSHTQTLTHVLTHAHDPAPPAPPTAASSSASRGVACRGVGVGGGGGGGGVQGDVEAAADVVAFLERNPLLRDAVAAYDVARDIGDRVPLSIFPLEVTRHRERRVGRVECHSLNGNGASACRTPSSRWS